MLRASCRKSEIELDVRVVTEPARGCAIPHFAELLTFADALVAGSDEALASQRARLEHVVGAEGTVRAAAVVANFQTMNRALDTIGATLGEKLPPPLRELAEELGVTPPPHWR